MVVNIWTELPHEFVADTITTIERSLDRYLIRKGGDVGLMQANEKSEDSHHRRAGPNWPICAVGCYNSTITTGHATSPTNPSLHPPKERKCFWTSSIHPPKEEFPVSLISLLIQTPTPQPMHGKSASISKHLPSSVPLSLTAATSMLVSPTSLSYHTQRRRPTGHMTELPNFNSGRGG